MTTWLKRLGVRIAWLSVLSACRGDLPTSALGPCVLDDSIDRRHQWWMLVHPSDAPDGPGIVLYDAMTERVECRVSVPTALKSPHALSFDGSQLWVGGYGDVPPFVYTIDPESSSATAESWFPGTGGLAVLSDSVWHAKEPRGFGDVRLVQSTRDGRELREIPVTPNTIQDVAATENELYYSVNDQLDRIVRVDLDDGTERTLVEHAGTNALCTLALRDGSLFTEGEGALYEFDAMTGEHLSTIPIAVDGWITAIAPATIPRPAR